MSAWRLPAFSAEADRRHHRQTDLTEIHGEPSPVAGCLLQQALPGFRWKTHRRDTGFGSEAVLPQEASRMLLTITTTHRPAHDLGYLLHKPPQRFQSFDLSFGKAHVYYPEVGAERCTACLLLDVDSVGMVRG